jgi:hypothetical protein
MNPEWRDELAKIPINELSQVIELLCQHIVETEDDDLEVMNAASIIGKYASDKRIRPVDADRRNRQ